MIDWNKVMELRGEIGDEDFAEVVELFLEEVEEVIVELRAGVPEDKLEGSMHFLKGSALNLGFETFSKMCAEGETAAASGDYERVELEKIIRSYDISKARFLEELEARLAA